MMFTLTESRATRRTLWWARIRAVIAGIGFFFPGFLLSLFITVPWANHHWAGDGQAPLAAIGLSFWIGVASSAVCCIFLLRRANKGYSVKEPDEDASA